MDGDTLASAAASSEWQESSGNATVVGLHATFLGEIPSDEPQASMEQEEVGETAEDDDIWQDGVIPQDHAQPFFCSLDDVLEEMREYLEDISHLIGTTQANTRVLLDAVDWDIPKMLRHFNLHKLEQADEKYMAVVRSLRYRSEIPDPTTVVYEELEDDQFILGIQCHHLFHYHEWKKYFTKKIQEGEDVITCPVKACKQLLDQRFVRIFLDDKMAEKYKILITNKFVQRHCWIRKCPGKGCEQFVKLQVSSFDEVTCLCGHEFCFQCGGVPHGPVECTLYREWRRTVYIFEKSRHCPQCNKVFSFDDRLHIKCEGCDDRFCILCLKPPNKCEQKTTCSLKFGYYQNTQYIERASITEYVSLGNYIKNASPSDQKQLHKYRRQIYKSRMKLVKSFILDYFLEGDAYFNSLFRDQICALKKDTDELSHKLSDFASSPTSSVTLQDLETSRQKMRNSENTVDGLAYEGYDNSTFVYM